MSDSLKDALDAIIEEAAIAYAEKWRLIDDQGRVWCATDNCQSLALIPSLLCPSCLASAWQRLNITQPRCQNREQKPAKRAANGE
jgi:hypothetical protein